MLDCDMGSMGDFEFRREAHASPRDLRILRSSDKKMERRSSPIS